MSVITQEYDIDLKATGEYPVVKMSQFDTGSRTIVFTVYDGHELAGIDGMVARVDGTRSDGVEFSSTCTVGTGSKVSFTISQEMTKHAGKHAAELVIFDASGNPAGTQNFIIDVEAATMVRDSAASADDRTLYDQFTDSVSKTVADKISEMQSKYDDFTESMDKTLDDGITAVNTKVDAFIGSMDKSHMAQFSTYEVGSGLNEGTAYGDYDWTYCRLRVVGGICTLSFYATRKAGTWEAKAWERSQILTLPDGLGSLGDLNVPIAANANGEPNNSTILQIIGNEVAIRPSVDVTYATGTWFQATASWVAAGQQFDNGIATGIPGVRYSFGKGLQVADGVVSVKAGKNLGFSSDGTLNAAGGGGDTNLTYAGSPTAHGSALDELYTVSKQ